MRQPARFSVCTFSLIALASCANPVVAPPVTPQMQNMDCTAIEADIDATSQLKRDARAEDKFMWRYAFVVNGFVSAYRINKAEAAAEERLVALREAGRAKGCFGSQDKVIEPGTPVTPEADISL